MGDMRGVGGKTVKKGVMSLFSNYFLIKKGDTLMNQQKRM